MLHNIVHHPLFSFQSGGFSCSFSLNVWWGAVLLNDNLDQFDDVTRLERDEKGIKEWKKRELGAFKMYNNEAVPPNYHSIDHHQINVFSCSMCESKPCCCDKKLFSIIHQLPTIVAALKLEISSSTPIAFSI